VLAYNNSKLFLEQRGKFEVGDTLEVVSPHSLGLSFIVTHIEDEEGNVMESAPHAMQKVWVDCPYELQAGDLIRKRLVFDEEK
jgi:putative protease